MNKVFIVLLIGGIALLSAYKNVPFVDEGESISIFLSGIEFNKSLHNAKATATVTNEILVLESKAKCDNFNDPGTMSINSTVPVLLTKIDNSKPFTFIAKVTPIFHETYDAGTMYIYLNQERWLKFAFEMGERMNTRAVTVSTIKTSDDNNRDIINSTSMYMKISPDTKSIGFYHSLDKKSGSWCACFATTIRLRYG